MSANDFFAKIDGKLGEIKQKEQQASELADENAIFLEEIVTKLTTKVEEYVNQLNSRNIQVNATITKRSISFTLKFKDGGHHGTRLGQSLRSNNNRIEITNMFTNDDGKNYTSTSGMTYDHTNWKDEFFISAIEKCIEDFLFYAPRHGGV